MGSASALLSDDSPGRSEELHHTSDENIDGASRVQVEDNLQAAYDGVLCQRDVEVD